MNKWKTMSLVMTTASGVAMIGMGWDADGAWLRQLAVLFGGFFVGHVVTEVLTEGGEE